MISIIYGKWVYNMNALKGIDDKSYLDVYVGGVLSVIKKDYSRINSPTLRNMIKSYFFPHGEMFRYTFWVSVTYLA